MFPKDTPEDVQLRIAAMAHPVAMEALLSVPKPKGVRFRNDGKRVTISMGTKLIWGGILALLITGGLIYAQIHTMNQEIEHGEVFHDFLWLLIGTAGLIGVGFTFRRDRIRIKPEGFVVAQPVLGLALARRTIWWEEVIAIGSGASVGMQGGAPVPIGAGTSGGHLGVAPLVHIKATCGNVRLGAYLNSAQRTYIREALAAYCRAWREVVETEVQKLKDARTH